MSTPRYDELFKDFWNHGGKSEVKDNQSRTLENMTSKLGDCQSIEDIETFVFDLKTNRESTRKLIIKFFDYIEKKLHLPIDSSLREITFYDYPFQRQLEIAKFLHKPHTRDEIMDHFHIDGRTLRKDLQALCDEIEVLGAKIKLDKSTSKHKIYYHTTMHPIFLPLNLTEVYALTVYLDNALENDPNAQVIRSITSRIKGQLSDYARNKLFPNEASFEYNRYVDDKTLAQSREGIIMYLMKSSQSCSFYLNGEKKKGRIIMDQQTHTYQVELEDGTRPDIDLSSIEFIIDDLDYK